MMTSRTQISRPIKTSRKRSFVAMICATALTSCNAFLVAPSAPASSSSTHHSIPNSTPPSPNTAQLSRTRTHSILSATTASSGRSKQEQSSNLQWADQRLTHEEQQELLRQTVERRRIRTIEADLRDSSSSSTTIAPRTLALACGYGDDTQGLQAALDRGVLARSRLVTTNMGLVSYCCAELLKQKNRHRTTSSTSSTSSVSRDDLLQEGAIGLARAIDRWNVSVGGTLSTYAVYWIRAGMLRCLAERDDVMRVPEHVSTALRKVQRAADALGVNGEDDTNAERLAEAAGLTHSQVTEAMKVRERRSRGTVSFESWMQNGKDYETDWTMTSGSLVESSTVSSALDSQHMKQTLARFLRPKEMEALSWRYGLNDGEDKRDYVAEAENELFGSPTAPVQGKWGEAMSFTEVGKQMQVSAEYGRRLCHAALNKLRLAAEEGTLEPALLC